MGDLVIKNNVTKLTFSEKEIDGDISIVLSVYGEDYHKYIDSDDAILIIEHLKREFNL